jgi:hypothetical protein
MRIIAAAAFVLVAVLLANGSYLLAISTWFIGGAAWTFLDRHRPMIQRSVAAFQPSFLWWAMVLWPIRMGFDFYYTAQLVVQGQRYRILDESSYSYRSFGQAKDYATESANRTGRTVVIIDEIRMTWRYGEFQNRSWIVKPSRGSESHVSAT